MRMAPCSESCFSNPVGFARIITDWSVLVKQLAIVLTCCSALVDSLSSVLSGLATRDLFYELAQHRNLYRLFGEGHRHAAVATVARSVPKYFGVRLVGVHRTAGQPFNSIT